MLGYMQENNEVELTRSEGILGEQHAGAWGGGGEGAEKKEGEQTTQVKLAN